MLPSKVVKKLPQDLAFSTTVAASIQESVVGVVLSVTFLGLKMDERTGKSVCACICMPVHVYMSVCVIERERERGECERERENVCVCV